jgi:hypothetical protein
VSSVHSETGLRSRVGVGVDARFAAPLLRCGFEFLRQPESGSLNRLGEKWTSSAIPEHPGRSTSPSMWPSACEFPLRAALSARPQSGGRDSNPRPRA